MVPRLDEALGADGKRIAHAFTLDRRGEGEGIVGHLGEVA